MEKRNYRLLKSQTEFLKLLVADIISRFGDSIDVIAYSWIAYKITGSEALMALVVGLNFLPSVLISPFAGAIVDRLPKKKVMAITDLIRGFFVVTIVILYANNLLNAGILIMFTLLTSTVEAFRIPASGAITPLLLERDFFKLGKAASYSSSRSAELIGFIVAGYLIAIMGANKVLLIDAATFLCSAIIILTLKYKEPIKEEEK